MSTMAWSGRLGLGSVASRSSSLKTGREETQAWAATIAMVNCIASSSSIHIPSPQARMVSCRLAPAPRVASRIARTVRIMQTTHESGIHRCVNADRRSPKAPMVFVTDVGDITRPPAPHHSQSGAKCWNEVTLSRHSPSYWSLRPFACTLCPTCGSMPNSPTPSRR